MNPDDLLASFLTGEPAKVYEEAKRLAEAHRSLQSEAAKLRFRLNFATALCDNCEGLRAGPTVVATCFQVRECNYTNIRTDDSKRLRVLDHLFDKL